ncbi:MAG: aminotransferase class V-fold PLP-dependent enzyme [candidate division KSB1 bacterium]|nr:aminotransferase class V-fold PLP-dependent enzyme [candidate division KSB1 bacterium]MDZ7385026.1 aminotransferase class V-fold PLP-dependent enzyme [candidate division KSB1 bacterium]
MATETTAMLKPPSELTSLPWLSDRSKVYVNWAGAERVRADVLGVENRYRKWQHLYEDDPKACMRALRLAVAQSRNSLSAFIGCPDPAHVVFTTGSEAALKDVLFAHQIVPYGARILVTDCEFYGIYSKVAPPRYHADVARVAEKTTSQGIIDEIIGRVHEDTRLLLLSHVCYNTGVALPIADICARVKAGRPDVLVLVDGAQAVGHVPVAVQELGCDFYAGDAHKWLVGPDQTGFLYVRAPEHLQIIARDASSPFAVHPRLNQDKGSRSGAVAFALAALGDSLRPFMDRDTMARAFRYVCALAEEFRTRCVERLQGLFRVYPSPQCEGRTAIVSLVPQGFASGAAVLDRLHDDLLAEGVHCALINRVPAAYAEHLTAPPMLRFSFHVWNSEADVEAIVHKLELVARRTLMAAMARL